MSGTVLDKEQLLQYFHKIVIKINNFSCHDNFVTVAAWKHNIMT